MRRYLEEEASIDALESTSDELLEKLELRKDAGTLDLSIETLNNLKKVLQNADLVKFARSAPALGLRLKTEKWLSRWSLKPKKLCQNPH